MKNLGVKIISLDDILMTINNERKTWTRDKLDELVDSIRKVGVLTPVITERLKDPVEGRNYRLIAGNRRFVSSQIVGLDKIPGRIFEDLTQEQRIEIHLIENATKTKIAPQEHADSYWDLYKILVAQQAGIKGDEILAFNPKDYWSIDEGMRRIFSLEAFARSIGKSSTTVHDAFLYERVNKNLRGMVDSEKLSYSVALQFGRIENKNEQIIQYGKLLDLSKKVTKVGAKNFVDKYLQQFVSSGELELSSLKVKKVKKSNEFLSDLGELISFQKKIDYMFSVNHDFFSYDVLSESGKSLKDIIEGIKARVEELVGIYCEDEKFKDVEREFERKKNKKGLLERILAGEVEFEDDVGHEKVDLGEVKYLPSIDICEIGPCHEQPRKSFNYGNMCKMAKSMDKYGVLQPIMIRPKKKEGYEIIVGENRYWAAAEASIRFIDALVVDVDDVTAQIIRYEEDFYEEVILNERAEKIKELFEHKKKLFGEGYTKAQLLRDVSNLGAGAVGDALKYAGLDSQIKGLHEAGLISFSHGVVLGDVEDVGLRQEYAVSSIVLGWNVKKLQEEIFMNKYQSVLPFAGYDYGKQKIKGLNKRVVQKFEGLAKVLSNSKFESLDGDKEFYRKLYELRELSSGLIF